MGMQWIASPVVPALVQLVRDSGSTSLEVRTSGANVTPLSDQTQAERLGVVLLAMRGDE